MNELIERLAREAGFAVWRKVMADDSHLTEIRGHCDGVTVELHRFAELVAEECAKTMATVSLHTWVDGSDQYGNPCPAKILSTPATYAEVIRAKFSIKP